MPDPGPKDAFVEAETARRLVDALIRAGSRPPERLCSSPEVREVSKQHGVP